MPPIPWCRSPTLRYGESTRGRSRCARKRRVYAKPGLRYGDEDINALVLVMRPAGSRQAPQSGRHSGAAHRHTWRRKRRRWRANGGKEAETEVAIPGDSILCVGVILRRSLFPDPDRPAWQGDGAVARERDTVRVPRGNTNTTRRGDQGKHPISHPTLFQYPLLRSVFPYREAHITVAHTHPLLPSPTPFSSCAESHRNILIPHVHPVLVPHADAHLEAWRPRLSALCFPREATVKETSLRCGGGV
ncbi:hypothetical protein C8R45DRAFT_632195 [Mycena sanguinolenta]|nr:hypothetical protein C8R45DRAFT_632195 [Mycena sanguinolenta]